MTAEKFKPVACASPVVEALRELKPGQVLRFRTAAEWRNATGNINNLTKKSGVKFCSTTDGDDVLVFLKEQK